MATEGNRGNLPPQFSPITGKIVESVNRTPQIFPMSSITKYASGYRAQVYVKGQRDSATFPTKKEAQLWAAQKEIDFQTVAAGKAGTITTTHDAFERYKLEVSIKHKGERWEVLRLDKMAREFPRVMLDKVTPDHVIQWRDARLGKVGESSVLREMKLLSAVFEKCCSVEWRLLTKNPCKGVDRPKESAHRTRTISFLETRKVLRALGYPQRTMPRHAVAHAFLLALATGMRQGELAAITWANVKPNYIHLTDTKNGKTRDVPLSAAARKLVEKMRGYDDASMFAITAASIDTQFRNAKARAGLEGFTWHDTRHTAATRIGRSGKWSVIELCKAFGWSDPRMAMVYFNPTGDELAAKL
jgi:integrase